jgi:nucleoside 2-deoxyribosyltransferase
MKIYLAGPEVFLPDAVSVGKIKQELCRRYGFTGLFPLDNEVHASPAMPLSKAIFDGNIAMLDEADIVLANLTPYRGISADVGTVFEVGYGFARAKPVFGYSNSRVPFIERVVAFVGGVLEPRPDGRLYAGDRLAVEDFDRFDNLMIAEALIASGVNVVLPETAPADPSRHMGAFEQTLRVIAERMAMSSRSAAAC